MPILNDDTLEQQVLPQSQYGYSATKIEQLGAQEYTLATVAVDISGSTSSYLKEMEAALKSIVQACASSPRADNLMIRVVTFDNNLDELHGFKLLENINPSDYDGVLHSGGSTALYDATNNSAQATIDYAKQLMGNDFQANAIMFVITDGDDNASVDSADKVKKTFESAVTSEALESMVSVLIGVGASYSGIKNYLDNFSQKAGFTQYVDAGDADAKTLAKLAQFVSKSISSQSNSLGTGSPSQSLVF